MKLLKGWNKKWDTMGKGKKWNARCLNCFILGNHLIMSDQNSEVIAIN